MSRLDFTLTRRQAQYRRGEQASRSSAAAARAAHQAERLWAEGGEELLALGRGVTEALKRYEGKDTFLVSLRSQMLMAGASWLPTPAQVRHAVRKLGI